MDNTLMQSGLELSAIGMGTVFVFLGLLVLITRLMSSAAQKIVSSHHQTERSGSPPVVDEQLLAMLQDAVRQHRALKKQG